MKTYQIGKGPATTGVPMDSTWHEHVITCKACQKFDGGSAKLALLCLEGSILYKQSLPKPPPEVHERDENKVPKKDLRAITRYK